MSVSLLLFIIQFLYYSNLDLILYFAKLHFFLSQTTFFRYSNGPISPRNLDKNFQLAEGKESNITHESISFDLISHRL